MRRTALAAAVAAALLLLAAGGGAYALFFTARGSRLAAEWAVRKYAAPEAAQIRRVRGTLAGEVRLRNIDLESPRGLPEGTLVRVQELRADLNPLSLEESRFELRNGRVFLPGSQDPVVLFGRYRDRRVEGSVYSRVFGVQDLSELGAGKWSLPRGFSGTAREVDCRVWGTADAPRLSGQLEVGNLTYRGVSLRDAPTRLSLRLKRSRRGRVELRGQVVFLGGSIVSRGTTVRLLRSRLTFSGSPRDVEMTLRGTSDVEGTAIRVYLRGTPARPELRLSSDPPLPQSRLLLMLVTGKGWKGADTLFESKQIPLDMARDFVDLFFLSEGNNTLGRRLGLDRLSVMYDTETGGVGVSKPVTERVDLKFSATPLRNGDQPAGTAHSVGAAVKVTDKISVEAQGETRPPGEEADPAAEGPKADGKVLLKYKTRF